MKPTLLLLIFCLLSGCSMDADSTHASTSLLSADDTEWDLIFSCEGEEAIVKQHNADPTRYQLTLKNNEIIRYLELVYSSTAEGHGAITADNEPFSGFASIISRFDNRDDDSKPSRTAWIYPDHGGLKVQVEAEPFYNCDYDLLYGDSSGMTHTVRAPIGTQCPNLWPSYGFRSARPGSDTRITKNWFFQTCSVS